MTTQINFVSIALTIIHFIIYDVHAEEKEEEEKNARSKNNNRNNFSKTSS